MEQQNDSYQTPLIPDKSGVPVVNGNNEWEALTDAVKHLGTEYPFGYGYYSDMEISTEMHDALAAFEEHVPKLLDAYSELWEMTQAMMAAWEQMQAEKDKIIVATTDEVAKFTSPFLKG